MRRNHGSSGFTFLAGAAMGAGVMFLMDPSGGAYRRSVVRGKLVRGLRAAGRALDKVSRDLRNRLHGSRAELTARMREEFVDDETLIERVRAQIGHVLSHPGAIFVEARDGVVTVSGPVLSGEAEKLRHRLEETRGVRECRIAVNEEEHPERVPGLQGVSRSQRRERKANP